MPGVSNEYELLPSNQDQESQPTMGTEEQRSNAEAREGDQWAQYVALITLFATWITVLMNNPTQVVWFAFHPLLQSLAMFLFTYGIITLQPTNQPRTKVAGLRRHQAAIFYFALPLVSLGTLFIMYNKSLNGTHHFKTWHGTLGILSMVWILMQVALGGASVWFNGAAFGGGAKAKAVWKYHRLSGYLLFPLLLLTVNLGGAWSHWGQRHISYTIRVLVYVISPAAVLTAVVSRVRLSKMKFI
ncbi:hypothetical protein PM082_020797 [Marasmius tenuissimus]|nr:hypothetical protein PM082_020797 [Marasmius tenuissimus]